MSPVSKPTFPPNMNESDLYFENLVDVMVADKIFLGAGSYSGNEIYRIYINQNETREHLHSNFEPMGELAEKPGKLDSKITKIKTRNYTLPGKRASTIELNISGLSIKQKDYLEGRYFMGKYMTIVVTSADFDRVLIFNGLRWTVDWSGEADGLFSVVISTEFSGITADKIYLLKDIPPAP